MANGLNGVNLEEVGNYVEAVKGDNDLAKIKFVAESKWRGGTKADVTVGDFFVNGQNGARDGRSFQISTNEPKELGGSDDAANPAEMLAVALAGCLTAGITTNAAIFETEIDELDVKVEVNFDLMGILGLDRSVPCSAQGIHYTVRLKGKGDKEKLLKAKETIDRKSAVRNTLENTIPVTTDVIIE